MKTIDTYLSVDLDYWGAYPWSITKRSLINFMSKIDVLDVPIKVVVSHEEILQHLNKYKVKNLINIDYHSDIANEDGKMHLCDGTWVNYYKYKEDCSFIWYHPIPEGKMLSGRCDDWRNKRWEDITSGYKTIESRHTLRGLDLSGVGEICFAISPGYLCSDMSWLCVMFPGLFGAFAQELAGE